MSVEITTETWLVGPCTHNVQEDLNITITNLTCKTVKLGEIS